MRYEGMKGFLYLTGVGVLLLTVLASLMCFAKAAEAGNSMFGKDFAGGLVLAGVVVGVLGCAVSAISFGVASVLDGLGELLDKGATVSNRPSVIVSGNKPIPRTCAGCGKTYTADSSIQFCEECGTKLPLPN